MNVFRTKRHTFKIILLTSLLWLMVDLLMIFLYTDCAGDDCTSIEKTRKSKLGMEVANESLKWGSASDNGYDKWRSYPNDVLLKWKERSAVLSQSVSLPGEKGVAVKTRKEVEEEKKKKFKINQFNLLVSDMISVNRSLKDVRLADCRTKEYPTRLPQTSIVIVFHNEAWSTLLRTLFSIVNRSPMELVKEIILVDDASSHTHLGNRLEKAVTELPVSVRVLRTGSRSGLIRARLLGASKAHGPILTFLDSHVEVTEGWLEPLLTEVASDRKRVVCPIIDVISDETFESVREYYNDLQVR